MSEASPKTGSERSRAFLEHFVSVASALFLVFLIRSSFFESYKIPSGSMVPTILIGDHVFVNKFAYRFTLPFSEYFGDPVVLFDRDPPKRGDILVFESPRNPKIDYIKRVVGLPGETIQIRNRQLTIDGKTVPLAEPSEDQASRVADLISDSKVDDQGLEMMKETLDERTHWIFLDGRNFVSENFGPYVVPDGSIFVMGDNRDFSDDSRFIGPIPIDRIRGRASWIWLSIWLRFDPFELDFRPLRTGRSLYRL